MQQYVFPVVFLKDEDESYTAYAPDVNLSTSAPTIEEAFLYIQDMISVYGSYLKKYEPDEELVPSKFEQIEDMNKSHRVMLVDIVI